jgi:hypothetical protein
MSMFSSDGGGVGDCGPVDEPLVDDAHDEVAEYRLQEEHLRDESVVEIPESVEPQVVRNLQTQCERHLRVV